MVLERITRIIQAGCAVLAVLVVAGTVALQAEPLGLVAFDPDRNPAYERRAMLSRVETAIVYVENRAGPLPVDGLKMRRSLTEGTALPPFTIAAAMRVLLAAGAVAALVVLLRRRGALGRLMRSPAGDGARRATAPGTEAEGPGGTTLPDPRLVERLRQMADREAAIVLLLEAALAAAAQLHGLRLGRSETARDFLRRLPGDWTHLPDLRRLVLAEELVQFGGRRLPEPHFYDALDRAVPILAAAAAGGARR